MLCNQRMSSLPSSSHRQPMPFLRRSTTLVSSRRSCKQPQQQRLLPVASSYTQPAVEAIRSAQQQACRQGSIFVAPPHLLLGLLDVPTCTASQLLEAAGLSAAAADAALVDRELLPKSSFMAAGDLHWAPDARVALTAAAEAAQAAGLVAAGTPHLLLGLLTCSNSAVAATLAGAGIAPAAFEEQVREAAASCSEAAATQPASAEEQRAALVANYQRHLQQHGPAPPQGAAAGLGQQGSSSAGSMVMTPEDDDIYN